MAAESICQETRTAIDRFFTLVPSAPKAGHKLPQDADELATLISGRIYNTNAASGVGCQNCKAYFDEQAQNHWEELAG